MGEEIMKDFITDEEMSQLEAQVPQPSPSPTPVASPDFISDDDMMGLEQEHAYQQAKAEQGAAPESTSMVNAALTHGAQGLTLGFSDELRGLGEGAYRSLINDEGDFSDLYEKYKNMERDRLAQTEDEHPYASFLGEVGGGLLLPVPGLGAAKTAAAGAKTGSKLLTRLAPMVAMGAITGAGKAKDLESIPQDAALGGALGLALPLGIEGIKKAGPAAGSLLKQLPLGLGGLFGSKPDAFVEGLKGNNIGKGAASNTAHGVIGAIRNTFNDLSNKLELAKNSSDIDAAKFIQKEIDGLKNSVGQLGIGDDLLRPISTRPVQINEEAMINASNVRHAAMDAADDVARKVEIAKQNQLNLAADRLTKNLPDINAAEREALDKIGATFTPGVEQKVVDENQILNLIRNINKQNKPGMVGAQEGRIFNQTAQDLSTRDPAIGRALLKAKETVRQGNIIQDPLDVVANKGGIGTKWLGDKVGTAKTLSGSIADKFNIYQKEDPDVQRYRANKNPLLEKVDTVNKYNPQQMEEFLGRVAENDPNSVDDVVKIQDAIQKGDLQKKNSILFNLMQKPSARKHIATPITDSQSTGKTF